MESRLTPPIATLSLRLFSLLLTHPPPACQQFAPTPSSRQQCAQAPDTPPPRTAPALGQHAQFSHISEAGEDMSEYSVARPMTAAAAATPEREGGGSQEEKVEDDGFGGAGYGVAMSAERLGEGSESGHGNAGGGGPDGSGEAGEALSTPTRRAPIRRGMVHHWVGSYEVFMDYDPALQ